MARQMIPKLPKERLIINERCKHGGLARNCETCDALWTEAALMHYRAVCDAQAELLLRYRFGGSGLPSYDNNLYDQLHKDIEESRK